MQCRPDCCPYCAETYDESTTAEQQQEVLDYIDELKKAGSDDPLVRGKGEALGGDVMFSMEDTDMLPPLHPNCRCTARYIYD